MGALPFSIGMSLILSLITWFSLGLMMQERTHVSRGMWAVAQERKKFTEGLGMLSHIIFSELTGKEPDIDVEDAPAAASGLQKNTRSKKNTSKLHIREAFLDPDSVRGQVQVKIFRNLLKILYGSLPLFPQERNQEASLVELFDEVRTAVLARADKNRLPRGEHLGGVKFVGEGAYQKQFLLNAILKGANAEIVLSKRCIIPRLTDYIATTHREQCVSIYKAPQPILLAVFQDPAIVEELMAYRGELYRKLVSENSDQGVTAESLTQEFKTKFESKLPNGIDAKYIEFTVNKGVPIDSLDTKKKDCRAF